MSKYFGDHQLTLKCFQCGHEVQETVARLETSPDLTCPTCGVVTHYNAEDFRLKLGEADRALDDFYESLKKLGET